MRDFDDKEKKKILVVEDDLQNQKFLEVVLSKEFEVDVCDSEQTFYEQLERKQFDIFLIDISIRGNKDGLQLIKEIKLFPDYADIPVICLTGHGYRKDKENAMKAGADAFLIKPIYYEDLINTILEVGNWVK